MKLIPVDPANEAHLKVLYELLAERTPVQSISHKKMPTWEEHLEFVSVMSGADLPEASRRALSYEAWYIMGGDCEPVWGACYLTRQNEIGVSLFSWAQAQGHGAEAVRQIMEKHGPRRYLANINPANEPSRKMFERLGFKLVQHTYALEAE